jgi:hypothetical protein
VGTCKSSTSAPARLSSTLPAAVPRRGDVTGVAPGDDRKQNLRRGGRRRVHRKFESHERLFQLVEERRPQALLQAQPRRRVGRAPHA